MLHWTETAERSFRYAQSIRQLKKIHSATHPGASLEKKKPASTNTATQDEDSLRASLLATLDAEAEEESE